jgi:hypothetical protein
MKEEITVENFLEEISTRYLPEVVKVRKKLDDVFSPYNDRAFENIKQIMDVVSYDDFCEMVDSTGEVSLYYDKFVPLKNELLLLRGTVISHLPNPIGSFYWEALSGSVDRKLYIRASKVGIKIGNETYHTHLGVYNSHYRFFFYDFGITEFAKTVRDYLERIGVHHE